jgi:predicted DNA-binding protein
MLELEYLTDTKGKTKAVVIPIEVWERLFIDDESSIEDMTESMEDYALGKAMDEAKETPLLDQEETLAYLDA